MPSAVHTEELDLVVAVEVGAPSFLVAGQPDRSDSEHRSIEATSSALSESSLVLDQEAD
jgi:hypothetical protein